MSFWSDTWEKVQDTADGAWDKFLETGVPAIKVGLMEEGKKLLEKQQQTAQAQLDAGVAQTLKEPSNPLTASIANAFGESILKDKGPMLLAGGAALVVIIFLIARKA